MKKIIALVVLLLFVPSVSMCAEGEVLLGTLTKLGVDEETLNTELSAPYFSHTPFTRFEFFSTLSGMVAALKSGRIAAFRVDENTADYLISRTKQYVKFSVSGVPAYSLKYSMLLMEENAELCKSISSVIADMKADGTIAALKKKYIDECIAGSDPEAVKPEHFDGAQTLKVALTGDRPPMDYFEDTGEPIGFNTALVSEIAKRLKMNTEFISINSGARAAALASKACDVVFWSESGDFDNREGFETEDLPEHAITTTPYLSSSFVWITLSSSPLLQK